MPGNKIGDDGRRPCRVVEDAYSRLAWRDTLDAHMEWTRRGAQSWITNISDAALLPASLLPTARRSNVLVLFLTESEQLRVAKFGNKFIYKSLFTKLVVAKKRKKHTYV